MQLLNGFTKWHVHSLFSPEFIYDLVLVHKKKRIFEEKKIYLLEIR